MTNLISSNSIENTVTYKSLCGFQKTMSIKRENRAILEQAFIHYKTTGDILPQLTKINSKILKDIIENYEKKSEKQH